MEMYRNEINTIFIFSSKMDILFIIKINIQIYLCKYTLKNYI